MSPTPDPRAAPVRRALGRLCTRGLRLHWIRKRAGPLLELGCVLDRAASLPLTRHSLVDGDRRPEALVDVLREVVGHMRGSEEGEVLWIVLGLDPRFEGASAILRREAAGREFRGGEDPVRGGTIRQLHEPRALDLLTERLLAFENAS